MARSVTQPRYKRQKLSILLLSFLGLVYSAVGQTEGPVKHAILVGVTDYPHLDESLSLSGSENDVELVHTVLLESGFAPNNIQLLTANSATQPSRAAIYQAFAKLKQTLQKNRADQQFVYVHFSGHGSQQPAKNDASELDGFDEIFLPMDVTDWNFETNAVNNAITDNEVGDLIQSLRETGAFVWVMFDACHSGTMTRSISQDVTHRKLDRCALGMPDCDLPITASEPVDFDIEPEAALSSRGESEIGNESAEQGGMVAFYAAQSNETTPELYFPVGERKDEKHGLFTYLTMQALSETPRLTYRQLAQRVIQKYNSYPWFESRPLFEGDGMDTYVFGEQQQTVQQWALSKDEYQIRISAGLLHGLSTGSVLALFAKPGDDDEKVVGYLEVTDAIRTASELQPVEFAGMAKLAAEQIPHGAYVRLAVSRTNLELAVAIHPASEQVQELIKALADNPLLSGEVSPVEQADVVLALKSKRLWVLDPGQALPCALQTQDQLDTNYKSPNSGDQSQKAKPALELCLASQASARLVYLDVAPNAPLEGVVAQSLQRVARVYGMMRLAGQINSYNDRLVASLDIVRSGSGETLSTSGDVIPTVYNGDSIGLSFVNQSYSASDVSLFFIGSDYSITQIYPAMGESSRVLPRGKLNQTLGSVTTTTIGREYLVLVANEVDDDTAVSDNSFLQQSGLSSVLSNEVTQRLVKEASPIEQLWDRSVHSGQTEISTRSFNDREKKSGTLKVFSWKTSL